MNTHFNTKNQQHSNWTVSALSSGEVGWRRSTGKQNSHCAVRALSTNRSKLCLGYLQSVTKTGLAFIFSFRAVDFVTFNRVFWFCAFHCGIYSFVIDGLSWGSVKTQKKYLKRKTIWIKTSVYQRFKKENQVNTTHIMLERR